MCTFLKYRNKFDFPYAKFFHKEIPFFNFHLVEVLYRYKHTVYASEKCFGDIIDICAYMDL